MEFFTGEIEPPIRLENADRYSDNWPRISRATRAATRGLCCWCCTEKAIETHHVHYWRDGQPVKGLEQPGIDVFGVCDRCHSTLHTAKYWIGLADPLARRNTPAAIERLSRNYRRLSCNSLITRKNRNG